MVLPIWLGLDLVLQSNLEMKDALDLTHEINLSSFHLIEKQFFVELGSQEPRISRYYTSTLPN